MYIVIREISLETQGETLSSCGSMKKEFTLNLENLFENSLQLFSQDCAESLSQFEVLLLEFKSLKLNSEISKSSKILKTLNIYKELFVLRTILLKRKTIDIDSRYLSNLFIV